MSILAKETIDVIQPGDIIWWVEPFSLDFVTNAGKTDRFDLIVCVCVCFVSSIKYIAEKWQLWSG